MDARAAASEAQGMLSGLARLVSNSRGAVAVEFVLVLPLLGALLFGITKFGTAYTNRLTLTDATRVAVRQLAVGRSSTTSYTDAMNAFKAAAPRLDPAKSVFTASVNDVNCSSDAACNVLLLAATGLQAKINATYPCDISIMGTDYAPNCKVAAQTIERIE